MANTTRTYTSDGIQTIYPVDFTLGFIHRDYVYIHLESDVHTTQLSYSWIDDSQIQLDTPVASTVKLVVSRVIPRDILVNDYEDGAILRGKHLDESNLQHLMLEEEGQDASTVSDTTLTTLDNKIDAEVVTLNTRIDTEVTTLNGRTDTEVATLVAADAALVAVDEALDVRVDTLEASTSGDTRYIHWLYNGGSAIGGETTITSPYNFTSVATVFINGVRMSYGLAFEYDVTAQTVTLAEALDITDEVVVSLGTEPVQDYSDLVTDVQLAEIQDITKPYIFDNVSGMATSTIVFPIGKILETGGYYTKGDAGQARYLIKAAQAVDGYGDHTLANGTVAVLQVDADIDSAKFGVIYGGSTDQTAALESAITYLDNTGFYLNISSTAKANVDVSDVNVRIKGEGELQAFTRTSSALRVTAEFNTATAVSAIVTVTQTVGARSEATVSKITTAGHTLLIGDVVKVTSEDVIPTTKISEGCRNGEWGVVLDVVGNDVYINRVLEETYTTTPKIAALTNTSCDIQLKITSTDGNVTAGSALAIVRGFLRPTLNLDLQNNDGVGLAIHGCYQTKGFISIKNLTNDIASGMYGYGVIEAGNGLSDITINQTGSCRHAYTTGVASKTDTAIYTYGESWCSTIKGKAQGASSNAWDTHSQGNGIVFDGVEAYGVQSMFQSRSRNTRFLHPTGSDMFIFAQVRNSDTGTKADAEITGFNIKRCKKPFNLKDDSASSNEPNVVLRGDSFISHEPTSVSAAIDSDANLSIYGALKMQMLGGTDANFIAQTGGNINIYGNVIFDSLNGTCTKPFKLNDCNFTVHGTKGGHIQITSASIGKLFTANDAPSGATTNVKANDVETNIALSSTNWFEFPMATQQLTIGSTASQTSQSSFQFISTSGGNTDIEFNSLNPVIYLQFSTSSTPNDTITSVSDGNFPSQQLFIDNASGSTLNIPNSLSNVEYTKTIPVNNTDTLTWRGTYWA